MPEPGAGRAVGAVIAIGVVAAAAVLFTLQRRQPERAGTPGHPVVLVLSPAHGDAATARDLGAALSSRSGLAIEVRATRTRAEAVETASLATVDGGLLPLFDYLLAHQELGVQAALQLTRGDGDHEASGVIVVRADSEITAPAQLADQPVAFVDRSSTTGYLLAARFLQDQHVTVRPVFTGDHETSLARLAAGDVVAAATFAHARDGVRVLASTGAIPNEPFFFHPRLPAATRDRIVAAITALAADAEGRALLGHLAEATGVSPVDDSAYGPVNDLLAATRRRLVDLVPDGHVLVERDQRRVPPAMGQ